MYEYSTKLIAMNGKGKGINIAMLSVHSSPLGALGSQDTGGMSVYIRELAAELGREGHRVDIFTMLKIRKQEREINIEDNVRLIHVPIGKNGHVPKDSLDPCLPHFFESLETYRKHNDIHYDIIHSHYWLSGRVGSMAQHRWNVPHVVMFHTTGIAKRMSCSYEKESLLRLVAEKRLAHECNRILAPTIREKAFLSRYYSVPPGKIGLVPCGVNLKTFHPVEMSFARKQLGLKKNEHILLFVGRFAPVKGLERLMTAMTLIRKNAGTRLIIAGGDGFQSPAMVEMKHYARKLGIHHDTLFAGRVDHDDLLLYYNAADVLVVSSYYESFGLVALESLACGTPVVAARVGAMDSIIQQGRTGEIVDSPSPGGMARAIERVLSQKQRGFFLPAEIRKSVTMHNWTNIASSIIDEYSSVIQSNEPTTLSESKDLGVACGNNC